MVRELSVSADGIWPIDEIRHLGTLEVRPYPREASLGAAWPNGLLSPVATYEKPRADAVRLRSRCPFVALIGFRDVDRSKA